MELGKTNEPPPSPSPSPSISFVMFCEKPKQNKNCQQFNSNGNWIIFCAFWYDESTCRAIAYHIESRPHTHNHVAVLPSPFRLAGNQACSAVQFNKSRAGRMWKEMEMGRVWRKQEGDLENFINTHVGISFVYKLSVAFLTARATGVGSRGGGGGGYRGGGVQADRGLLAGTSQARRGFLFMST